MKMRNVSFVCLVLVGLITSKIVAQPTEQGEKKK